jgi:hypothetical protein
MPRICSSTATVRARHRLTETPPPAGRCSVVFDEPGQILACQETIAADREVEVVRVNNKLARTYDAGLTAGYRCAARIPARSKGSLHVRPRAQDRLCAVQPRPAPPATLACCCSAMSQCCSEGCEVG